MTVGPGVEGKALALPVIGAATGLVALFDDGGGNAVRLQPEGKRHAAEPRADDAGGLAPVTCQIARIDTPSDAAGRFEIEFGVGIHSLVSSSKGVPGDNRARTARGTATGGLPHRMRARSAHDDRAA